MSTDSARPRLRRLRFQFSLQTLLVVMVLWSAGLGAWSYFTQLREKGAPILVVRDAYVGVIFPRNTRFWEKTTTWEPTLHDVDRAEARVKEFLGTAAPRLAARLDQYVRQYFGVVVAGRRMIECSFLDRRDGISEGTDWSLRTIGTPCEVMDGGEGFFQLLYDPKADSCSGLHVNAVS